LDTPSNCHGPASGVNYAGSPSEKSPAQTPKRGHDGALSRAGLGVEVLEIAGKSV
jgi:hypothetical protein